MVAEMRQEVNLPVAPARMQRSQGRCHITTKLHSDKTVLDDLRQQGASRILLPRANGSEWLDAVLVNTSGGLTGGDDYHVSFQGAPGTKTMLTSQACEKNYRSLGDEARLSIDLTIGADAALLWCPQETIVFNRARVRRSINVDMEPGASALVMETFLFGRSASGEIFEEGEIADDWRIRVDGKVVHAEAFRVEASKAAPLSQHAILGGHRAASTVVFVNPSPSIDERSIVSLNQRFETSWIGVSSWEVRGVKKLVVRAAAPNGYTMRGIIDAVFGAMRLGRNLPRVWYV